MRTYTLVVSREGWQLIMRQLIVTDRECRAWWHANKLRRLVARSEAAKLLREMRQIVRGNNLIDNPRYTMRLYRVVYY